MRQNELDKHLNDIAVMVSQQQGLQFDNQQQAQQHLEQTISKLQAMLRQSSALFIEGLRHLADANHTPVSEIASALLQNVRYPDKLTHIIETRVVQDPNSLANFSEAVNRFYGCGDFHVEECVIAVHLTLFPLEPQPFACYGTFIWRKDGIEEAVNFYKNIADLFENPILDYFAADCHYKAGNRDEAKRLLQRATQNAAKDTVLYADILPFIRIMTKEFQ